MEVQARKFYSQRNMYLCGFTLFLSLILNRTYMMILEILRLEEKVKEFRQLAEGGGTKVADPEEVAQLRKQLATREKDVEALKKQSEGLSREYQKLGDQIDKSRIDNTPKKDR
jgi:small-conductance mechanosensitive channel